MLIALQGRLRDCRSFQTMSPVAMVEAVARSGRPKSEDRVSGPRAAACAALVDTNIAAAIAAARG